jgi:hypothetical protein
VGTSGVSGTGPWIFEKKVTNKRSIGPSEVAKPAGELDVAGGWQGVEPSGDDV